MATTTAKVQEGRERTLAGTHSRSSPSTGAVGSRLADRARPARRQPGGSPSFVGRSAVEQCRRRPGSTRKQATTTPPAAEGLRSIAAIAVAAFAFAVRSGPSRPGPAVQLAGRPPGGRCCSQSLIPRHTRPTDWAAAATRPAIRHRHPPGSQVLPPFVPQRRECQKTMRRGRALQAGTSCIGSSSREPHLDRSEKRSTKRPQWNS